MYSDDECRTLVTSAGEATVSKGEVGRSSEEKLKAGTYYWQASYSGDSTNGSSVSTCGQELLVVRKTLLATSLIGEGQSGAEIKVVSAAVHDTATLSGENASVASGTVKYDVYSDRACRTLVAEAGEARVASGKVEASREETLAAGTYYWQATYSGDSKNEGSTTQCDEENVVVGPTPPQVEQVNFTNNMPVIVDAPTTSEHALAIEDFTGLDNVEWEYSPTSGELVKNWPVAYVQETTPTLKARFELPTTTKQLILERKLEGKPVITGQTRLNGEAITFSKEIASVEALEAQVKKHEGYIEIGESPGESPVSASKALPARVGDESMTIEWTWTIQIAGTSTRLTQGLGSSQHDLLVTFAEPSVTPCKTVLEAESAGKEVAEHEEGTGSCTPLNFTMLNLVLANVEQVRATEAQVIAGGWRVFTKQGKEAVLRNPRNRVSNPGIPVPFVAGMLFNPRTARFESARWWYRYYTPVFPGRPADFEPIRGGCGTYVEMLYDPQRTGRCGAWAEAFVTSLRAAGANSAELVHLAVTRERHLQSANQ